MRKATPHRVEYTSRDVDFVIDDATFTSPSFLPDRLRFVNRNDLFLSQGQSGQRFSFSNVLNVRYIDK
jgi:hypothetical protein